MPAVLFDLDGTLHDRASGIAAFAADQYSRLGTAPKQLSRYVNRFQELDANGKVWKNEVYSKLIKEFELKGSPTVDALIAEYVQRYPNFAVEVPESKRALKALKQRQVAVGILTNGRGDLQRSVIACLGFDSLVQAIVVSEEVGFRKPQREIFEIMLSQLNTEASDAIMVGDDPLADVEGAIGAGLYPIAFNCGSLKQVACASTMTEVLHAISSRFAISLA